MANIIRDFKEIKSKNSWHGCFIVGIVYMEGFFASYKMFRPLSFLTKIARKFILQFCHHCEIAPTNFHNLESIKTLRLPHPYLVIVNQSAKIGKSVTIFHNVTIGAIERKGYAHISPRIGDGVYIGTGASILGPVEIQNNTSIGAHALVLRSNSSEETTIVGIMKGGHIHGKE